MGHQENPTHLAVLFDGEHENKRALLDEKYKANRFDYSEVAEEENPFSQLSDVYAALDFMKILHAETTDCETDDWIAGYANTYAYDAEIIISSFDSDFFQLINDHVSVLRYRGEKTVIYTPKDIQEKWGILPAQYADFKSLTGDAADHIKGAEKIGPKTAALLLNTFGSLENILANAEQIPKASVRESVLKNAERLKINYSLIKLSGGGALPFSLQELLYHDAGKTTAEILKGIGLRKI